MAVAAGVAILTGEKRFKWLLCMYDVRRFVKEKKSFYAGWITRFLSFLASLRVNLLGVEVREIYTSLLEKEMVAIFIESGMN